MPTSAASNNCRPSAPPVSQQPLGVPSPPGVPQSFTRSNMPLEQSSQPSVSVSPHFVGSSGNGSLPSVTPSPSVSVPAPPPPPPRVHCASNSAFKNSLVPWLSEPEVTGVCVEY